MLTQAIEKIHQYNLMQEAKTDSHIKDEMKLAFRHCDELSMQFVIGLPDAIGMF